MGKDEKRDREVPYEGGMNIFIRRASTRLVIPGPIQGTIRS
jgi:hypothetical protein